METKEKSLESKAGSTYVKGLPFTLDFKKMFEKTITSRHKSEEQDIIELTKLGIENSDSFVDVQENRNSFSVEFDGQGVSSKDDLVKLMLSLYSEKSANKLSRLGTAIMAALSKKPLEILVETHHNGDSICMSVDSSFKPRIYKPRRDFKNNKITVIKRKSNLKSFANDTSRVLFWPVYKLVDKINGNTKNSSNKQRKEKIAQVARYTDKKVTYNGKKYNKGFTLENALFQAQYKIENSRILLSIPHKNYGENKKTIYLKKDVPICENINVSWYSEWGRYGFYSGFGNLRDVNRNEYIIAPNIIVSNPDLESTIDDDFIIENNSLRRVKDHISKAKSRFYTDFLTGKFDEPNVKLSYWSPKELGRERFLKALFFNKIKNKNIQFDTVREYVENKKTCLEKLSDNEVQELERFFSIKLFKDIDGKEYSIPETYKLMEKNSSVVYYMKKRRVNRDHPALKGKIDKERVLFFENDSQETLFEEIFPSRRAYEQENYVPGNISPENPVILKSLDFLVDNYYREKKEEILEKIEKAKRVGIKSAKVAGCATGGGAVIVGGYYVTPYVWNGIKFLFLSSPEILVSTGVFGAVAYGAYKSAPHVIKAMDKASPYMGKGLIYLWGNGKVLARQSMKAVGSGCRIIGEGCHVLAIGLDVGYRKTLDKLGANRRTIGRGFGVGHRTLDRGYNFLGQGLENADGFVTKKSESIGDKISGVWSSFTTYAIKKPIKSTISFIGKKLTEIDDYIKAKAEKAKEAERKAEQKEKEVKRKEQEEIARNYCLKFGDEVKIKKRYETYLDYLIGYVQKGCVQNKYRIFAEIGGVEITDSIRRKPFNLRYHKSGDYWLQINVSSSILENKVNDFYGSEGRTLFTDLQEIGNLIGRKLLRDTDFMARRERLDEEIINKLYYAEFEKLLDTYRLSDGNFNEVFESLGKEDKKYVLKRIIEDNSFNGKENSLEDWLIDNHSLLLEEVSEEMISQRSIKLLKKAIDNERLEESVMLFEELTPNEKARFINEHYCPNKEKSKAKNFLDAHIRASHPLLELNSALQQKYEEGIDNASAIGFYCEADAERLVDAYRDNYNGQFNKILWPSLEEKSEKSESLFPWFWSGKESEIYMGSYSKKGILSDAKRAMEICLGAFYMLPKSERKEFLKKIRNEQSKNPYYKYFTETINQYKPEYKEIFSSSSIII